MIPAAQRFCWECQTDLAEHKRFYCSPICRTRAKVRRKTVRQKARRRSTPKRVGRKPTRPAVIAVLAKIREAKLERACLRCDAIFTAPHAWRKLCEGCLVEQRRAQRRAEALRDQEQRRRAHAAMPPRSCMVCRNPIPSLNMGHKTCSAPACVQFVKQQRWRRRHIIQSAITTLFGELRELSERDVIDPWQQSLTALRRLQQGESTTSIADNYAYTPISAWQTYVVTSPPWCSRGVSMMDEREWWRYWWKLDCRLRGRRYQSASSKQAWQQYRREAICWPEKTRLAIDQPIVACAKWKSYVVIPRPYNSRKKPDAMKIPKRQRLAVLCSPGTPPPKQNHRYQTRSSKNLREVERYKAKIKRDTMTKQERAALTKYYTDKSRAYRARHREKLAAQNREKRAIVQTFKTQLGLTERKETL
jgi:hypothetical protein